MRRMGEAMLAPCEHCRTMFETSEEIANEPTMRLDGKRGLYCQRCRPFFLPGTAPAVRTGQTVREIIEPNERCPTCGEPVVSIFDHIDIDCSHD